MKRLIEYGRDDHPDDDPEQATSAWSVTISDDCETCEDPRVVLTLEPVGKAGTGVSAHLAPVTARTVIANLQRALKELGEPAEPPADLPDAWGELGAGDEIDEEDDW